MRISPKTELDALRLNNHTNRDVLEDYITVNRFIQNIIIYPTRHDTVLISGEQGQSITKGFTSFPVYKDAVNNHGQVIWTGLHTYDGRYFSYSFNNVLSCVRSFTFASSGESAGVIEIQVRKQSFDSVISGISDNYGSMFILTDNNGRLISANGSTALSDVSDTSTRNNLTYVNGIFDKLVDSPQFYIKSTRTQNGWALTYMIPKTAVQMISREILMTTFYTTAIYFFLSIIIALLASMLITKPINELVLMMHSFGQGNASGINLINSKGHIKEVEKLKITYNSMIQRIRSLIRNLIDEQTKKRETELSVLQAQINPHFLYNSLNLIRLTASMNEQPDIESMTVSLINLLEFSLKRKEYILISEEIEMTRQYLNLYQFHHESPIHVDFAVDPALEGKYILKMVLMPLVENAIIHAYRASGNDRDIRVLISRDSDARSMTISVADKGAGISKQRIDDIMSAKVSKSKFNRIGINNIQERIQLGFGSEFGVRIVSRLEEGTTVFVRMPILDRCDQS